MRRKMLTVCEICGGASPSGAADFLVFHCLTFCSPDCLGDYRTSDEEGRAKKNAGRTEQPRAGRSRAA
ncbi:MAG: hypothetical protein WCE79_21350 [Xanthobacteraceae bacterium]